MSHFRRFLLCWMVLLSTAFAQGIVNISPHGRHVRPIRPHRRLSVDIEKHHVQVVIVEGIARTTVTQVFRNPNAMILEGSYVFPIPEDASLTEFTMIMNGKKVVGEVLERDKARGIYEAIVAKQRDPALLEYVGRRLFRARVFPIPAKGTAEVSLTYVEELKTDAGIQEYRYPLKTQAFSKQPVKSLAMHISVESSSGIQNTFSPSHKINVSQSKVVEKRIVSFEGKQALASKDFHLLIALGKKMVGCNLLTDFSKNDGGFFLLRFAPNISDIGAGKPMTKDVVFVVDTSGSMREDKKMEQAKRAIVYGLKGLNPGDRFNIVAFSTDARPYAENLQGVDDKHIAAAIEWVNELKAGGGTNIHDALVGAFPDSSQQTRPLMVVFLTDGMPTVGETNVSAIRKAVKESNAERARLFVWGVGYDVNTLLLDALAEENRGVRDYVTPSQDLEIKLSSFFDKISSPVLSNLKITVDGVPLQQVYPRNLPDLFRGGECVLLGRYKTGGATAVRLAGTVGDTKKEFVFEKKFAESRDKDREFVALLWARRKVGFLLDQIRLNGENRELKNEVVRLAKKYALATPYTSLLVTDDSRPFASTSSISPAPIGGGGGSLRGRQNSAPATSAGRGLDRGRINGLAPPRKSPRPRDAQSGESARRKVERSLGVKHLREELDMDEMKTEADDFKKSVARVRVGSRTFVREGKTWVDVLVSKMDAEKRKKLLEKVDAYSARYFELIRKHPKLATWMAKLGHATVFLEGRVIQINPQEKVEAPKKSS